MKVLHIVPGLDDITNGMAVVVRFFAKEQVEAEVMDLNCAVQEFGVLEQKLKDCVDEVWVHGMWLPKEWAACRRVLKAGKRLVRMTHGSLSPVYLKRQSPFKKWLVGPIERWLLRKADRIVATCDAEKAWIEAYLGKKCPEIVVEDVKRFFDFSRVERVETCRVGGSVNLSRVDRVEGERFEAQVSGSGSERDESNSQLITHSSQLNLLYLGRRHPLKGVEFLEAAVRQLQNSTRSTRSTRLNIELRIVSDAKGEELEKVWEWCDVLVLPTLSENFGLVVAEALERGKCVVTTDGAPVWGEGVSRVERVETCREGGDENLSRVERVEACRVGGDGNLSRVERVETCREGEMMVGYGGRLIYLKGYREGTKEARVELLKAAIEVAGDGNLSRVERVETCRVGGDENLSR